MCRLIASASCGARAGGVPPSTLPQRSRAENSNKTTSRAFSVDVHRGHHLLAHRRSYSVTTSWRSSANNSCSPPHTLPGRHSSGSCGTGSTISSNKNAPRTISRQQNSRDRWRARRQPETKPKGCVKPRSELAASFARRLEALHLRARRCLPCRRHFAEQECHILLFERKTTAHTGDVVTEKTRTIEEQLGSGTPK